MKEDYLIYYTQLYKEHNRYLEPMDLKQIINLKQWKRKVKRKQKIKTIFKDGR